MMDGFTIAGGQKKGVVFLTEHQTAAYGGIAGAARAFGGNILLPLSLLEDFHSDLATVCEVGHA